MEEHLSTVSLDSADDPHLQPRLSNSNHDPILRPRPFPSRNNSFISRLPTIDQEIYIVQIPKEQIFSVPPPVNTIIAERYRNPKTKESPRRNPLLCVIVTLIVVSAIVGLVGGILHIVFNPKTPAFSLLHVRVKNSPSSSHKNTHNTHYEITLKVKNGNEKTENSYRSGGDITLLYKGHKIGAGESLEFDQAADSSRKIGLELSSSKRTLPEDIARSINDKKGKKHVSLVLKMDNIPVKMKFSSKVIDVACSLKVSSLGASGDNVLSQHCETKFN